MRSACAGVVLPPARTGSTPCWAKSAARQKWQWPAPNGRAIETVRSPPARRPGNKSARGAQLLLLELPALLGVKAHGGNEAGLQARQADLFTGFLAIAV